MLLSIQFQNVSAKRALGRCNAQNSNCFEFLKKVVSNLSMQDQTLAQGQGSCPLVPWEVFEGLLAHVLLLGTQLRLLLGLP